MHRATLSIDADEIGPEGMSQIYILESNLIDAGWDAAIYIDDESLARENGIIDYVWLQATKGFGALAPIIEEIDELKILSAWLEFKGDEYAIVGGMIMPDTKD